MTSFSNSNYVEANFDGLVGSTHNYAGLSLGNLASESHAFQKSSPKQAALQGLEKMRILMELGIPQAFIPPHPRPYLPLLRQLGFQGPVEQILRKAYKQARPYFFAAYSASSMWTANMATVSPSLDTLDSKLHLSIANLKSNVHRAIEADLNYKILKKIFSNPKYFTVHPALPNLAGLGDEGAANHLRFASEHSKQGLEVFIYGTDKSKKYPSRQNKMASLRIAENHQIRKILFLEQNPKAIDFGVFHNDVISLANENLFLVHESAFLNNKKSLKKIEEKFPLLNCIEIPDSVLSLKESVKTYLFNSQLVTKPNGKMALIVPEEVKQKWIVIDYILSRAKQIDQVVTVNCRESMRNGGGPACLRLKILMNQAELKACYPGVFLDQKKYGLLKQWINTYYRDILEEKDLLDPELYKENQRALEALGDLIRGI
ncbi:MAG: N-succinylarginine dihydrolase [Gammaproteobacteria bacterium]